MTSTARSNPVRTSERLAPLAALAVLALAWAVPMNGHAKQSDRSAPVEISSDYFDSQAKPNGVTHLKGHVVVTQGTLKATSGAATVHFDADSRVKRVILEGSPARLQQMDDNGNLIKGRAGSVDYQVPKGIATLTDDAYIEQVGRGTASGQVLVYNTKTSTMSARGQGDSRVHLTFQPSKDESGQTAPASASSGGQ